MASTAATPDETRPVEDVSLIRLYVLRAMYLVLVVGLGAMIVPEILSHEPASRGVIASLLGAVWLLAFVGLRYPLEMLPLLLFEFTWKLIWMVFYGLPQWSSASSHRPSPRIPSTSRSARSCCSSSPGPMSGGAL